MDLRSEAAALVAIKYGLVRVSRVMPKQELGGVQKDDIVGGDADGAEQRAFLYVIEAEMTSSHSSQ